MNTMNLRTMFRRSQQTLATTYASMREASTYSRQDRGLYGGTEKQFGNSISKSHQKTARTWKPNVHAHTIRSEALGRNITMRMTANVWRTIKSKRYGGSIDAYLTSESKGVQRGLGTRGEGLRQEVLSALSKQTWSSVQSQADLMSNEEKQKLDDSVPDVTTVKETTETTGADTAREAEAEDGFQSDKVVSDKTKEKAKSEGIASGM